MCFKFACNVIVLVDLAIMCYVYFVVMWAE